MEKNTVDSRGQLAETEFVRYYNLDGRGPRIMFVGNSITLHGLKADIGWHRYCGMAASAPENDYVHLVMAAVKKQHPDAAFCICQVASWEREYKIGESLHGLYENARNFDADVIIFRAIENCPAKDFDGSRFGEALSALLGYLDAAGTAKLIFTTGFWRHPGDTDIIALAREMNCPLAELGDLGELDEMKAIGLFEHTGVANHPGDKGMREIAERIMEKLKVLL